VESAPRAYRLKAGNAASPISTFSGAIPRYTYKALTDRSERSRRDFLAPGCCLDRDGVEIGRYDDSEIQRQARKLALATAGKIFRGR
jgi:hypothetical protein